MSDQTSTPQTSYSIPCPYLLHYTATGAGIGHTLADLLRHIDAVHLANAPDEVRTQVEACALTLDGLPV